MNGNKFYETVPLYNFDDMNYDLEKILNSNISSYYKKEHIDFVFCQLYKHYGDTIYVNKKITIYKTDSTNIVNIKTSENNIVCKIIICINAAKRGGLLHIIDNFTLKKKLIHVTKKCFIVAYPQTKLSFTPVIKGNTAVAILECIIQPLKILYILNNNGVYYTNKLNTLLPIYDNNIIFAVKKLTDYNTNKVICTQLLINKKWFIIVECNQKKMYFPCMCVGQQILNFNYLYNIDENTMNYIINLPFPFNSCPYKKCIVNNKVTLEQVIFCKIQMKK
ncbi:hypothetical protein [Hypsugopox virus]|nr:hypothetical protein [Hypsugopox virus]